MWAVNGNEISMAAGDYGIALPITLSGATIASGDEMRLTIKRAHGNREVVLQKTYADIQQNTIALELTAADSAKLTAGAYEYSLDWYQNGAFMCNVIPHALFKVVCKA